MRRGKGFRGGSHRGAATIPVLAVGGGVLAISAAAFADTTLDASVSTGLTLTDNRDFEPDAEEDLILSVTPSIVLRQRGGRSTSALDYSLSGQYAHRDTETDLVHTLTGTNTLEVVDSLLFLDSSAAIDQQVINAAAGAPARDNQSGSNLSTVQRYSVSPYVLMQFGGFANSESRLRGGYVTSDSDDLDSETEIQASQRLSSGRDFTSFSWTLSANYLHSDPGNGETRESETYRFDTATRVNRQVTVLGGIGYEKITDDSLDDEPKGIIWNAGLRLSPGPKLTMEATYGERYEEQNINASVDYKITSRSNFNASYSQTLTTEQQLFLNDLSFIGVDDEGNLIDTRTGLPLDEPPSLFGLSDDTFRRDVLAARFSTSRSRDRYAADVSYEVRESGGDDEADVVKSVGASWSHDLTRSMVLDTSVDYSNIDFGGSDEGREDNLYTFRATLSEQIATDVDARATYLFRHLESNLSGEDATENAILFTLTKSF